MDLVATEPEAIIARLHEDDISIMSKALKLFVESGAPESQAASSMLGEIGVLSALMRVDQDKNKREVSAPVSM